jgi:hypothetical protein
MSVAALRVLMILDRSQLGMDRILELFRECGAKYEAVPHGRPLMA